MAIIKTKALILGKIPYSNTSLILNALTPDQGKINLIAKGARDLRKIKKSSKVDLPDKLNYCSIVYYESSGEIHTLSECAVEYAFPHIRTKIPSWKAGYNLIDLLTVSTFPKAESFDLFALSIYTAYELDSGTDPDIVLVYLLYHFLDCQGVLPNFFYCARSGVSLLANENIFWSPITGTAYKKGKAPISELLDEVDYGAWELLYEIINNKGTLSAIKAKPEYLATILSLMKEQVFSFLGYMPKSYMFDYK